MAALDDKAKAIIDKPNLAFVATVMADGSPQVTPVWIDTDGRHDHLQHRDGPREGAEHAPRPEDRPLRRRPGGRLRARRPSAAASSR